MQFLFKFSDSWQYTMEIRKENFLIIRRVLILTGTLFLFSVIELHADPTLAQSVCNSRRHRRVLVSLDCTSAV